MFDLLLSVGGQRDGEESHLVAAGCERRIARVYAGSPTLMSGSATRSPKG
jgi:hypothetical protein